MLDLGHNLAYVGTNRRDANTAIDNQLVGRLNLAGSFLDHVLIGLSLPMTLYENGRLVNGAEPLGPNGGVGFGDPRLTAMLRLFGHSDRSPISMHIGADVWIPSVGERNQQGHDGDASARCGTEAGARRPSVRTIRWAFNFGYYWRDDAKLTTLSTNIKNVVGDEVRAGIELGFTSKNNQFNIGPELWFSSHALNGKFFHKKLHEHRAHRQRALPHREHDPRSASASVVRRWRTSVRRICAPVPHRLRAGAQAASAQGRRHRHG